jgi:hypothetical protein
MFGEQSRDISPGSEFIKELLVVGIQTASDVPHTRSRAPLRRELLIGRNLGCLVQYTHAAALVACKPKRAVGGYSERGVCEEGGGYRG